MKSVYVFFLTFIATVSAGISRSDVHFNIGGSRIAYSINHRPYPDGEPNTFVSVSRPEPVHHHFAQGDAQQTPVHVPVDVATPAHHIPAPIYPASTFHSSLVYAEPVVHSPLTTMRHPKHYLDSYYPYSYAPYYPYADGHTGLILVA